MHARFAALAALIISLIPASAFAHGGGLNAAGCHNERRTGGYHCHRGPAAAPAPAPRRRAAPALPPVSSVRARLVRPPAPVEPATLLTIPAPPPAVAAGRPPITGSATVLDGDTIQIGAQRIRLWGIDAFEAAQTCNGAGGATRCGADATHELAEQVAGHQVICIYRDTDIYQRVVAVCRVGATDLAAHLVRRGHAIAYVRYAQDYVPDEAVARAERRGAWAGNFTPPASYRGGEVDSVAGAQRAATVLSATGDASCTIRGNINRSGERIYHLPGDPFYGRVSPEAMFCTEAEAVAAGFRRAGRPR